VNKALIHKINAWIRTWEGRGYQGGIPDEADPVLEHYDMAPSYRRICLAIVKNDVTLSSLGFGRPKCLIYDRLKKIELLERGKIKPSTQGELFYEDRL
jgi:predicted phosphoadenosine phosphosulfate sulfurtransferase